MVLLHKIKNAKISDFHLSFHFQCSIIIVDKFSMRRRRVFCTAFNSRYWRRKNGVFKDFGCNGTERS